METENNREGEKKLGRQVPIYWFTPKLLQLSGLAEPKPGPTNPTQVSHWNGRNPTTWTITGSFRESTWGGSWNQEQSQNSNAGTLNGIWTSLLYGQTPAPPLRVLCWPKHLWLATLPWTETLICQGSYWIVHRRKLNLLFYSSANLFCFCWQKNPGVLGFNIQNIGQCLLHQW